MNKIQEEHFKDIQSAFANGGGDDEQAAEICLTTTIKHMKGFAEWLSNKYEYLTQSEIWVDVYSYSIFYTTKQIIEEYIKQL